MATAAEQQAAADQLAQAHIEAERRLRVLAALAAAAAWRNLSSYNRPDVPSFMTAFLPVLEAAKRQSVALTRAYLARATNRPVVPVDVPQILDGLRNGTDAETVYTRAFVGVWKDLGESKPYEAAVAGGLSRVQASAETDVQLAMTHALRAVGEADGTILGYRRVPDPTACPFCKLIAGRRYLTSDLQPVHAHCGCGVAPITEANRGDFFGKRANDLALPPGVAVNAHSELGPLLGDPNHSFLSLAA